MRSVRCLTKDEIISDSCETKSRPAYHEFCNQVNCRTNGEILRVQSRIEGVGERRGREKGRWREVVE